MKEVMDAISLLVTDLLLWIGFGTLVGLIAKAILPGKDPGGALATVFVGIVGSIIGAATFFYVTSTRLVPISLSGFLVGLAGAGLLLFTYRVLNGKMPKTGFNMKWKKTRRRVSVIEEE